MLPSPVSEPLSSSHGNFTPPRIAPSCSLCLRLRLSRGTIVGKRYFSETACQSRFWMGLTAMHLIAFIWCRHLSCTGGLGEPSAPLHRLLMLLCCRIFTCLWEEKVPSLKVGIKNALLSPSSHNFSKIFYRLFLCSFDNLIGYANDFFNLTVC